MRRILVLSVTLLTIFLAGVAVAQLSVGSKAKVSIDTCDPILAETFLADPISAVGHGRMQNAEGDEIEVTPEFIFEVQRYYVKSLFQQADETQRAKFRKKQKHLSKGKECDQEDQVYVNFALIAWLIDTVDPENASTLASINTLLLDTFVLNSSHPSAYWKYSNKRVRHRYRELCQAARLILRSVSQRVFQCHLSGQA
jgi:hypothetical protein